MRSVEDRATGQWSPESAGRRRGDAGRAASPLRVRAYEVALSACRRGRGAESNVGPPIGQRGCSCFLVMTLGRWTSCCRLPPSDGGLGRHGLGELAAESDHVQKGTDGGG